MPRTLFAAAGTLRDAYFAVDWAATPLGPVEGWSPVLRGAVDLMLHSQFPMTLLWGPEFTLVYNEAYTQLIGDKHPAALGRPAQEIFSEAWESIGPLMEHVRDEASAVLLEDALVPLVRRGFLEDCWFTFCYSAVRDAAGVVEGVVDIATETTNQVLARRRLELLARLGGELAAVGNAAELLQRALPVLHSDHDDLPAFDLRLPGTVAQGPARRRPVPLEPELAPAGHRVDPRLPQGLRPPSRIRDLSLEQTPHGQVAWLPLGAADAAGLQPVMVVLLNDRVAMDDAYLEFLKLVAGTLGEALSRVVARDAERRAAEAQRRMSEALQRSLLTQPTQQPGLEVAVRYLPAAEEAHIGGDWYDAFEVPGGCLAVVVGDVTGHDREAAAAMAQVRSLLRGIAYTVPETSPALVLSTLDEALRALEPGEFATALLALLEPDGEQPGRARAVQWSNAGHPPPVLLSADGSTQLLDTTPDLLLGLQAAPRTDHTAELSPGDTLVLYTDGLVERRGVALDQSLGWLVDLLRDQQHLSAEALCDHVLGTLQGPVEDDVALLVLRVDP
jgi:serine phosphatase RsbU (regulator of sigma subunit)